jgi:hypothetical protein
MSSLQKTCGRHQENVDRNEISMVMDLFTLTYILSFSMTDNTFTGIYYTIYTVDTHRNCFSIPKHLGSPLVICLVRVTYPIRFLFILF